MNIFWLSKYTSDKNNILNKREQNIFSVPPSITATDKVKTDTL